MKKYLNLFGLVTSVFFSAASVVVAYDFYDNIPVMITSLIFLVVFFLAGTEFYLNFVGEIFKEKPYPKLKNDIFNQKNYKKSKKLL